MPSRRSASLSAWPSGAASRGSTRSAPSTITASPPSRRTTCASSTPAAPPPSTSRRRGTAFMLVASRVPQTPSSSRRPGDRRHERSGAGRHDDVLGGVPDAVDLDHAGAGQAARAAQQVDAPARPATLLAGVGVVRHHVVAPGQRGLHVDLRGRRPRRARRAPPRPAAAATSTECRPSTSTRRRPALAPRRRRAARPPPAPRRSARRAPRRRRRSRHSHWSALITTSVGYLRGRAGYETTTCLTSAM